MSPVHSVWRRIARIAGLAGMVYAGLVILYTLMQDRLIFLPTRSGIQAELQRAEKLRMRPWRAPDDGVIGWRTGTAEAENRLLIFHGNAGSALDRRYLAELFNWMEKGRLWEVIVLEYPGYGSRPGRPGQRPMVEAGLAAVDQLLAEDGRPLYLLGESIGSGVACGVVAEQPDAVAGMLLITPFRNLSEVAERLLPWIPVRLLLRHPFDNQAALEKYQGPVGFLLADEDEVVGMETGKALYETYAGPRWLKIQEATGHNTLLLIPGMDWQESLVEFWQKHRDPS